jgi:hypothetical protein
MLKKLNLFGRLDAGKKLLLIEAACYLLLARLMLLLLPFKRIAPALGVMTTPSHGVRDGMKPVDGGANIAEKVGWAVRHAARHVPFRAVCFPQAIAGRLMLKRRGIHSVLHLGTTTPGRNNSTLRAHAWLEAAGREVTGYPVAEEFTEVASFL